MTNNKYKILLVEDDANVRSVVSTMLEYDDAAENIVVVELMRRGYEVYVGVLRSGEVDFVAMKQDEKFYVQVSYDVSAEATYARELAPLLAVRDAYPKLLLARTHQPEYVQDGVRVVDVADWLLGK